MNQKFKAFSFRNISMAWAGLTILLVCAGLIMIVYTSQAKTFIVMLNAINVFLFSLFIIFRKNIERIIVKLIEDSSDLSFTIQYNYERKIGITMLSLFIIFCCYIIFLVLYNIESYTRLIREDGIVEYGSSIFWFLSAIIVCFNTIKLSKKIINRYQFIFNMMLILFFTVCSGEEISWGQRLFSLETPEFLKTVNIQNEISLHNIGSISVFSNMFFILTFVFFLFVPFIINKNTRIKNVFYFVRFPVPNRFAIYIYIASLFTWIFVGLRFGTLGFHPFSFFAEQYYTQMDDEIFEFFAAYSFLCFSIFNNAKKVSITRLRQQPDL